MGLIVFNTLTISEGLFNFWINFDPAMLYGIFSSMPVKFQSMMMLSFEKKMIKEAATDLTHELVDKNGHAIYMDEIIDQEQELMKNVLLESFINSRISTALQLHVNQDLLKRFYTVMDESVDRLNRTPALHQNFATNKYSSIMIPAGLNIPLSSIISGEKTLVKIMTLGLMKGFVPENMVDRNMNNILDPSKLIYTGLYGERTSTDSPDVLLAVGQMMLGVIDNYYNYPHEPVSFADLFRGKRIFVQHPPSDLYETIKMLQDAVVLNNQWYFNAIMSSRDLYYN